MKFSVAGAPGSIPRALLTTALLLGPALGGLGLGVALLTVGDSVGGYVTKNQIAPAARSFLVAAALGGALLGILIALWAVFARSPAFAQRLGRALSPLALFAVVPILALERIFRGRDLEFLLAVWAAGALTAISVSASVAVWGAPLSAKARAFLVGPVARRLGLGLVVLGALGYAAYFSTITLASHYNFCTSAFDLGIEDNLLWNAAHAGPLFRSAPLGGSMMHGGNHQTYFTFVLVPIYWLASRAETLLIVQSVFIGAGGLFLYLYALRRLAPLAALCVALSYFFYAPLHGANLYDFHYQPFGIFFTFLNAYLLLAGRSRWLLFTVPLMLSVREDMGAMLGALGAYFVLSGRKPRAGFWVMLIGSAYFVAFKLFIMPYFFMGGESSFTYMYKDLVPSHERGFGAVLKTVLTNPIFVFDTMLTREKLLYLLQIFVPVCALALKRSPALILFLPACTFTLLSTDYPALIMTTFQYTSYWTPMVFLAVVEVLSRPAGGTRLSARATQVGQVLAMVLTVLLTSNRYGAIFQTETARGAFDPVRVEITAEDRKNHEDFMALANKVPPQAKVVAAEWLVSHLSNRRDAYTLRFGVLDAEYLLFWTHKEKLRPDEKPILKKALFGKDARFGVVEQRGMFVLAKKGYARDKNDSLRSKL